MRRRPQPATLAEWPPALRFIVTSAQRECPKGHGDALRELTALAMQKAPARGIFDPAARNEGDLFEAIEAVAAAHLQMREARAAWRQALDAAQLPLEQCDEIEQAALAVQTVSDTAYFYAGLGFGLAFVAAYRAA